MHGGNWNETTEFTRDEEYEEYCHLIKETLAVFQYALYLQ